MGNHLNSDHKPHWQPDGTTEGCVICGIHFSLTKKHHCRLCGLTFCNECSSFEVEVPLYYPGDGRKRVCEACYRKQVEKLPKKEKQKTPKEQKEGNPIIDIALNIPMDELSELMVIWTENYQKREKLNPLRNILEYFETVFDNLTPLLHLDGKEDVPYWAIEDTPYSFLPEALVLKIIGWISEFPPELIVDFSWDLLKTHINSGLSHQKSSTGLVLLLQLIVRNYPYTVAEMTPFIQNEFMKKSDDGYLLKEPELSYIFEVLGQSLQTNPKISLYCWFELLLPTVIHPLTDPDLGLRGVRFIEILDRNFTKEKFLRNSAATVGTQKEYFCGSGLVRLVRFLNLEIYGNIIQDRLREVYGKIISVTVFLTQDSPQKYFALIFPLAAKIEGEDEEEEEEEEEDSSMDDDMDTGFGMCLKILALSLLRAPSCGLLLPSLYAQHLIPGNNLLLYFASHWEDLSKEIPKDRFPILTKDLTEMTKNLLSITDNLYNNTYTDDNGKHIKQPKTIVSTAAATVTYMLKSLHTVSEKWKKVSKGNSKVRRRVVLVLLLVGIGVYVMHANGMIPREYEMWFVGLVPEILWEEFDKAKKQVGF